MSKVSYTLYITLYSVLPALRACLGGPGRRRGGRGALMQAQAVAARLELEWPTGLRGGTGAFGGAADGVDGSTRHTVQRRTDYPSASYTQSFAGDIGPTPKLCPCDSKERCI